MKKIILVGTDEGSFDYNRNLEFGKIKDEEIGIELHSEMVFKPGLDKILIRIGVRYMLKKEQILIYSVALWFKVENWDAYTNGMSDEAILATDESMRMLAVTVGFLRGSLSLQERTTPFKGAFLPLINIKDLAKEVVINRLKDDSETS